MPRLVPSEVVRIIDELFSYAGKPDRPNVRLNIDVNGRVTAIISFIDRLPSELLALPPKAFADFLTNLEILRVKNATAMAKGSGYQYSGEPVWHLRRHLADCPDESAAESGKEFRFIDEELRNDLSIDLAEAYGSLHAGRFKAATVLAGAVIEALLVWRLSKLTKDERKLAIAKLKLSPSQKPQGEPQKWLFWQLIEVAAAVPVIDGKTATQIRLAKDFRNLIHPGASIRRGERCGKGTALGTLAGVELVVNALTH